MRALKTVSQNFVSFQTVYRPFATNDRLFFSLSSELLYHQGGGRVEKKDQTC